MLVLLLSDLLFWKDVFSRDSKPIPAPNVIPLFTTKFALPNIIMIIGVIVVTAPNVFPDSLFINLLCSHAVLKRSTDRE